MPAPDFSTLQTAQQTCNEPVAVLTTREGFYESYFLRANHPAKPLAFWIRYTLTIPKGAPEHGRAELWAIFFDGEDHHHTSLKSEYQLSENQFLSPGPQVRIDSAALGHAHLNGFIADPDKTISWNLQYTGGTTPLFLFDLPMYRKKIPKAKVVVSKPFAAFSGEIVVNGTRHVIDHWVGSQNHNWGPKHTDHYAWGQVAGFDNATDAFLEVGTARMKIGPFWTPFLTPFNLRIGHASFRSNSMWSSLRNSGRFHDFDWLFKVRCPGAVIHGRIHAAPEDFVKLQYQDPPGGNKTCYNSKIARCTLRLSFDDHRQELLLTTMHRAAFEILI